MAAIITRTGKGAAITQSENDSNLDSLCGINEPQTGTTYTVVAADQNSTIEFSNAAPVVATLALISTIIAANDTSDFQVSLKNIGAGTVTVTPTTDTFDDGSATKVLAQYEWITIQTDSTQSLWNIIASSNASKVDGLDASQFLRSDANTTAAGNVTINKATPILSIDSDTTGDGSLVFQKESINAALVFWERSEDMLSLIQRNVGRTGNAARLDLTVDGKVNVSTGQLQSAGVSFPEPPTVGGTVEANKLVSASSGGSVNFPSGTSIGDTNGNEAIIIGTTAGTNAQVTITNGIDKAAIAATGDNADADLNISAKGAGALTLNGYWHPELDGNGTQGRLLTSSSDTTNWTTITDSAMATAGATLAHIRVSNSVAANASATERVRTVYISNYVASFIGTAGVSGNMAPASNVRAYYYSVSHTGPTDTDYTDALVPVDSSGRFMWLVSTSFSPGGSASVTLEGYYT